jgi:hypothetical protein
MKYILERDLEVTSLYRLGYWYDRVTRNGRETWWLKRVEK